MYFQSLVFSYIRPGRIDGILRYLLKIHLEINDQSLPNFKLTRGIGVQMCVFSDLLIKVDASANFRVV